MKILFAFLILFTICSCLLNSGDFGNDSLTAYFGFCIMSGTVFLVILTRLSLTTKNAQLYQSFTNQWSVQIFILLVIYIVSTGFVNGNLNLTHYYWLCAAALLLAAKYLQTVYFFGSSSLPSKKEGDKSFITYLHRGIISIALIESGIVILQWLGLISSMNELFTSTGTWVNPNVTAIFLAMTLLSQKLPSNTWKKKTLFAIQLLVILLAIVLLQCRTAYLVSCIILLQIYKPSIPVIKSVTVKGALVVLLAMILGLGFKTVSTASRIEIWSNCLQLIKTRPVTGVGFGQFEKEYNLFVAQQNLASNDYVYMPYNDFLEIAVEGGIIAVVLWMFFLAALIQKFMKNNWGLTLIMSFIIVQLTNFGFQSIPVFALFLIYIGSVQGKSETVKPIRQAPQSNVALRSVLAIAVISSFLLVTKVFLIATAFHKTASISKTYSTGVAIEKFKTVSTINFSSNYHESFGDLFIQSGNFKEAAVHYGNALQTTSRPNVLGKYGWCLVKLSQFDSASYYFKTIEKLQPYKYAPRLALLKLYEQRKDTASIKSKAREIIAMPVKVPSEEVERIKAEAVKWLQTRL